MGHQSKLCVSRNKQYQNIFLVDTNGLKGPNQFGKDRWTLGWKLDSTSYPATPIGVKLYAYQDYNSINSNFCRTPNCYYKTWLYGN